MHRLIAHIQRNQRFVMRRCCANHRLSADPELMPLGHHRRAGLTPSGAQDSPFPGLIDQENAGIVETKGDTNNINRPMQQRIWIKNRRDTAAHMRTGM